MQGKIKVGLVQVREKRQKKKSHPDNKRKERKEEI